MKAKQNENSLGSVFGNAIVGAVISMVVTLALTAVGATLVVSEVVAVTRVKYYVILVLLASAMIGTAASAKKSDRKLYIGLIAGVLYFLLLLSVTAVFFEGQYHGIGVSVITVISGCVAAVLLGFREGKRVNKRRRRSGRR